MMTAVVTIALLMVLCPKTSGGALQEKDVSFKALDGLVLQGTLTLPELSAPAGVSEGGGATKTSSSGLAVVMVAGSGGNDRWETMQLQAFNSQVVPPAAPDCGVTVVKGGNPPGTVTPFRDIAQYLAGPEVAATVLTYDKRSCPTPKCNYTQCSNSTGTGRIREGAGAGVAAANCVDPKKLLLQDFVDDAVAAVRYVATLPGIEAVVIAGQ